jgi:hypothetical protein
MKALFLLLLSVAAGIAAPATNDITGNWMGTLAIDKVTLRLLFKIAKAPEGRLTAKLDSLDQGARDLPVDKVTLKGNAVQLDMDFLKGFYVGVLDASGKKMTGKWQQAGQSYPLTLERGSATAAFGAEAIPAADLPASKQAAQKLAGRWVGTISAQGAVIPVGLTISKNPQGAATGTLDSPEQGLNGVPLSAVKYQDGKLHFEAHGLGAYYDGVSFNDNRSVTGQWHQADQILPLSFKKGPATKP